jgi:hypothetical protein
VSSDGGNITVVLTDDTKVQQPKGLGLRKKQMSATVLVPGLRVTVDGVGDAQSRVVAKTINFDADDLEMAEAIQAGDFGCSGTRTATIVPFLTLIGSRGAPPASVRVPPCLE